MWHIPSRICSLDKPKEVISRAPSRWKQRQRTKDVSSFVSESAENSLLHMHRRGAFDTKSKILAQSIWRTHVKGCRCCHIPLKQGHWAVTNALHTQAEAWEWTDLNWCYSRRNQCIFLTAAITPPRQFIKRFAWGNCWRHVYWCIFITFQLGIESN